jgi:hypothetical protein
MLSDGGDSRLREQQSDNELAEPPSLPVPALTGTFCGRDFLPLIR